MGYPFGYFRYGSGLYSRKPDWWRATACEPAAWAVVTCPQAAKQPPAGSPLPLTAKRPPRASVAARRSVSR